MQITEAIEIAAIIPGIPMVFVAFNHAVTSNKVAIVIPETGLLLLPTSPTMREDTVAKKKPNKMTSHAPENEIGSAGTSQMSNANRTIPPMTTRISKSLSVRFSLFLYHSVLPSPLHKKWKIKVAEFSPD